jgi:hypothetical protein
MNIARNPEYIDGGLSVEEHTLLFCIDTAVSIGRKTKGHSGDGGRVAAEGPCRA